MIQKLVLTLNKMKIRVIFWFLFDRFLCLSFILIFCLFYGQLLQKSTIEKHVKIAFGKWNFSSPYEELSIIDSRILIIANIIFILSLAFFVTYSYFQLSRKVKIILLSLFIIYSEINLARGAGMLIPIPAYQIIIIGFLSFFIILYAPLYGLAKLLSLSFKGKKMRLCMLFLQRIGALPNYPYTVVQIVDVFFYVIVGVYIYNLLIRMLLGTL